MAQEQYVANAVLSPTSDGSSGQGYLNGSGADHGEKTFLTDPRADIPSSTIIPNSNSDGVATPKGWAYVLFTGAPAQVSMAENGANQGTICSMATNSMTVNHNTIASGSPFTTPTAGISAAPFAITTSDEALAVERSNMRFHQMIAKLNSVENLQTFVVAEENIPVNGIPTYTSVFSFVYLRKPVHPDPDNLGIAPGVDTVKRLAAEGIQFDDTDATQLRHVWKPANTVTASGVGGPDGTNATAIPQIVHRENVTANRFANSIDDLYANMTVLEYDVNPTHSLP
tara:strand:+ start:219 stop:1070 length:852 start_codon:yes stop_codon:yes gene_type:complete